jgi:hypothetical protein
MPFFITLKYAETKRKAAQNCGKSRTEAAPKKESPPKQNQNGRHHVVKKERETTILL